LREEILRTIDSDAGGEPAAIVTRNIYGAQVLNAARLLFLDIDVQPANLSRRIGRLFGGASPDAEALAALRAALAEYGMATFRIYRTASGFRVMAIDRDFNPTGHDVQELMKKTRTDPAFSQLCLVQRSFRARLTPKPWRCHARTPPGQHPRQDIGMQRRFAEWLVKYEKAAAGYATCRFVETLGAGRATGDARTLQELHDRATRCDEQLPLA
jgi:hypothetical protein